MKVVEEGSRNEGSRSEGGVAIKIVKSGGVDDEGKECGMYSILILQYNR